MNSNYAWILGGFAGALLIWKWRSYAFRSLLNWLGARRDWNDPLWARVTALLTSVARKQRVPVPALAVLPEFSPNALVLTAPGGGRYFLLSEGLVRSLSNEELEAALALCLAQGQQRSRALQTYLALALFPLARLLGILPPAFQPLFFPWFALAHRCVTGPSACGGADRLAAEWVGAHRVAASLQKMAALARKIPLQRWNMALDSLFLLSPTVLDGGPIWLFPAQAPVEKRREQVLSLACESPASLS